MKTFLMDFSRAEKSFPGDASRILINIAPFTGGYQLSFGIETYIYDKRKIFWQETVKNKIQKQPYQRVHQINQKKNNGH